MAIESFDDLVTNMAFYMKRQDLSSLIPNFIQLAESTFDKTVYVKARRVSYIFTPLQAVNPLPSDWKRVIQVWVLGQQLDFFPSDWDSAYAGGTIPQISNGYQIVDNNLVLSVRQLALTQLDYYQTLEGLSTANESNWLLEAAPDVYLWGALSQAAIYMRDNTLLGTWSSLASAAMQQFVDDDTLSQRPESTLTIRAG